MTLPELLGIVGGFFFGIAAPVAALVLGYGWLVVVLACPVGLLAGWLVGVGTTPVVMALQERAYRREKAIGDGSGSEERAQRP